jgi:very-short-patch-repair endonuclease
MSMIARRTDVPLGRARRAFVVVCFVAGYEIDAFWEELALAVEIDGWSTHGNRRSFESDRVRQEDLKLAGIEMIRVTATRIEREPAQLAQRLRILLDNRAIQQAAEATLSPHIGDNVGDASSGLRR